MQRSSFRKAILLSVVAGLFTAPAWCSRADKGGSSYGANTLACASGNGPQNPTAFGSITVTCFAPGSGVGDATLFELKNNTASFPSSFNVLVDFASPTTTDYGLITCDGLGSIPCTNKNSGLGALNPVDFSGSPSFGANDALFTFSNFTGELDFYINGPAIITNVSSGSQSGVPEPRNTALAGLLLVCSVTLIKRFVNKQSGAVQS